MLYTVVAFVGLVAGANALTIGQAAVRPTPSLKMKLERLPGEGDPFCDGIRKPEEGPRPDQGISRWHSDSGYIDEDDEPWCVPPRKPSPAEAASACSAPPPSRRVLPPTVLARLVTLQALDLAAAHRDHY